MPPSNKTAHRLIEAFGVTDNCLLIGGKPVSELSKLAGGTPFYAYDSALIRRRIVELRAAMPAGLGVKYAIKANPAPVLVHDIAMQVDGLDCASAKEMQLALASGIATDRISFAGPGKGEGELASAIDSQIVIVAESTAELQRIAAIASAKHQRARVMLRINPGYALRSGGMKMGGEASQFGIDEEQVFALLPSLPNYGFEFLGFHVFAGSQILDQKTLELAHAEALQLAKRLANAAPWPIARFNLGGGFGIPYYEDQQPFELASLGRAMSEQIALHAANPPAAHYEIELGRYICGEAGVYVCKVIDRKVSRGETFLVTDGGMHHHLAASGNLGGVFRRNYPVAVGNRVHGDTMETVTITGRLCTPLDVLARKVALPKCEPGDLILIFQSGAYGASASPSAFLGHPPPGELYL